MEQLEKIQALYEAYRETVEEMERKLTPGAGMFGLGVGARNHPCHKEFTERLEPALNEAAAAGLTQEEVRRLLDYIYRAPLERDARRSDYWMLLAAHNMTLELICGLSPRDAADLRAWYEGAYPKRDRLPAQNNVLAALKRQGQ